PNGFPPRKNAAAPSAPGHYPVEDSVPGGRAMSRGQLSSVLRHLRRMVTPSEGPGTDRDLLERFVHRRDEAAFAELLARHGPLVWGVCRRILRHEQDAEDAWQSAFLVLAPKAASVRWRPSVAGWLHEVAHRLALKARTANSRRGPPEQLPDLPGPQDPVAEAARRELCGLLDAELRRLPEPLRAPLLLCYLEGKTRDAAAPPLGREPGKGKQPPERGPDPLRPRPAPRGFPPP